MTAASSPACSATIRAATSKQSGSVNAGARSTGNRSGVEHVGAESPVSHRERTDGVPVVRAAEGEERRAARDPQVHPVLERDLQCLLHRAGAVGCEEEVRLVDGDAARERLGELDHDPIAVAEHRRVRATVELLAEGGIELRNAMPDRVHPEGGDGVEVPRAVDVDQLVALGAVDHDGRALREARHLREAVPDDPRIALGPDGGFVHRAMMPLLMTLRDKAAVVGVGATPYYKRGRSLPQTPFELAGKAMLAALDDAGLAVDDVDGLALYSFGLGGDTSLFAQVMGIPEVRFTAMLTGGGGGAAGSVGLAAAAIASGMATCVVSLMSLQQAVSRFGASFAPKRVAGAQYAAPPDTRGQLHPARRPDGSRPDVRGAHATTHAPVRHEARAPRRGGDLES